ncbi:MAG TPA: enoyl-CoA hydratase-related protein [Caulobacteraceae bacterium]
MADGQTIRAGGEIRVDHDAGITRLTIASPGKKNALSQAMYLAICAALDAAAAADDVKVVVLQGADGVFTSGNDVAEFGGPVGGGKVPSIQFLETIAAFPKPIVAQVEGLAIGIGSTMLLHCDLIYAAEGTRFQLPFVNLGLVPEAASSYLLPRLMGAARASELLLLGEMFSAAVAQEVGLVTQVLPVQDLAAHVQARAVALAAKPPHALRRTKALVRSLPAGIVLGRIAEETEVFSACVAGPEFAEALAAFQEKRPPDFSKL